jgi:signal transduction histidine kinase
MGGVFLMALSLVLFYIRYQARLQRQRSQRQQDALQHQKELLYASIRSQEEERRRIGRDLHDEVAGALVNLRMMTAKLAPALPTPLASAEEFRSVQVEQCKQHIDRILLTTRHIAHNLSPPGLELFGLAGALEEIGDTVNAVQPLRMRVRNDAEEILRSLDYQLILPLYRVLQELITNTIKHAGASGIWITLSVEEHQLVLQYRDDGRGFASAAPADPSILSVSSPPHAKGMGLWNIESRLEMIGARLRMESPSGGGFYMTIRLDLSTKVS